MFDWDEATVTDLQKSKWVFADGREMRKVRVPYIKFQKEHVPHIAGQQAVVAPTAIGHMLYFCYLLL